MSSKRRIKAAASSAENSQASNSMHSHSDSDDGGSQASSYKGNKLTAVKSSVELCASLGINDVELEWSDADYQNLTTFNIFVRMVRPQLVAANAKVLPATMTQILEAKWNEFQESNPFNKKSEKSKKEESSTDDEEDDDENSSQNGEREENNSSSRSLRRSPSRSENEDERRQERHDEEEDEEDEDEEERTSTRSKRQGLKIKLSIRPVRKSSRDTRTRKTVMTDKDFEKMLDSADESGGSGTEKKKRKRKRQNSDSDDGNSDSFRRERKTRGRKRPARKNNHSGGSDVDESSGLDGEHSEARKKRERKRQKANNESEGEIDAESLHAASNSDDSAVSGDSGGDRRKKKTKKRPVIPGERKSSRARKANASTRELTDKEFERMLEQEELEKVRKKRKRREDKKKATAEDSGDSGGEEKEKEKKRTPRPPPPPREKKEGGESGNESDHYWYCELCRDGGDLLLCDTCPKSFHKECLKLEIVPDGEWSCPVCTGEGLPEKGDSSEEDNHETFCRICKDGGDVILCDFCPMVYHMNCLNPPLKSLPDGDWKCPLCVIKANPPKAKVKQVLTWRWTDQAKDEDELDHTHNSPQKQPSKRRQREVFVKYEYHSYWDCAWVPEQVLEVFQQILHGSFRRKFDLNEPPALEDGSSFGRPRHKASMSEDDPHNLEERYYRYGIKPEWLQIHRIITHDGKGKDRRYLVKWRDLTYIDCTWEFPDEIPQGLEGFDKHVDAYWTRRKQKMRDDKELKRSEIPKKSHLRKKLERQPSYLDETGGTLHPYQLEGLNWLRFSWSQGTNTILADEMGLGKTIQSITFLYELYKEGYVTTKPFLISAPLSTVANWEREFELWAPELYVVTYQGHKETRAVIREQDFCYKEGAFASLQKPCKMRDGFRPKFDVLLTSYEFVSVDYATLSSIEWGVLIIDEAHRLKNNQSLFFRTLSDYKINYKLLLTGTPLQNNLEELFNLLNFLEPDKFSHMENFLREFSEVSKDEQVLKLHDMLAPHMLRRMKADVLKDIPSKSEFIVRIELSSMQKKYYKHILTKNYEALNAKGYSHQTSLINIMMDLRKCCNHPYLFPGAEKEAPISASGMYEGISMTKASGKLEMLAKMLKILKRDGHRVLIFSQMTRMLDILEDFLAFHDYGYERIDGSIAGNKRQESIDRFNSPESSHFVFLLSTRAGGLGINLATADTVIIYDMDWNPHNDIQAFSRAHRIGQKNKVMIYRYVTRNTVDEKIAQVCKTKMMLSELIVHRGMGSSAITTEKNESLTKQEISDILKYGAENLFKDDEEGQVVYSDEAIDKLLDRSQEVEVEKEKEFGMNEYLRSFKVASYQVKEGVDDDDEVEEEKEKEEEVPAIMEIEKRENETDVQYWQRVLGPAYHDHVVQTLKEQEEVAKTLGKGKRVRKQINYAEKEMMDAAEALSKGKKKGTEEDVTFQSDYEPTSDSDDEDGSGGEEGAEKKRKHPKTNQIPKGPPVALPPLVERNEGQVLVLGFTARQRRAFLDAVMRYGMPPEDPYRSQWLVRDLRTKPERIFKAFVSLFMRHLCEPIADNAEKFADGVPREGLSRQHVLTRIGIIALIRKKVHEFEDINGTESMAEFSSTHTMTEAERLLKAAKASAESTANENKGKSLDDKTSGDQPEKEGDVADESKANADNTDEKEKSGDGEKNDDGKKSEGGEKMELGEKEEESKKEKPVVVSETLEIDEEKKKDDDVVADDSSKDDDKGKDDDDKNKDDKDRDDIDVDKSQDEMAKDDKDKEDEDKSREDNKEDVEKQDSKDENEDDKKAEDESDSKMKERKEEEAMEVAELDDGEKDKEAADQKDKNDDKEKDTNNDKDMDIDKDNDKDVDKDTNNDKDVDVDKDKDVKTIDEEESKEAKEAKVVNGAEPEKGGAESESGKAEEGGVKVTNEPPPPAPEKVVEVLLSSVKSSVEISSELRRRFWIADGGFTELHSLWHLEEMQLVQSKEFETWHRRHDFWLLAGVITHGYRHWQDILSDARFDLMNQAFKSDSERTRKAAFLNRRFQLLEQALVIEEQLRKASVENGSNIDSTSETTETKDSTTTEKPDHLKPLDDLANTLKSLGQGNDQKGTKNPKLNKVLGQIAALVNDINDMSYTNMPASLAKAYNANAGKSMQVKMAQPMKPISVQSATTGPWTSGYKPVMGSIQGSKPVYMPLQGFSLAGASSSQTLVQNSSASSSGEKSKDVICID